MENRGKSCGVQRAVRKEGCNHMQQLQDVQLRRSDVSSMAELCPEDLHGITNCLQMGRNAPAAIWQVALSPVNIRFAAESPGTIN